MLNSRFRALVAVMAFATAALAACGGGDDDDDKASVRLVNATARASLDLLANGDVIVDDTAKDTASAYVDVDTGSPSLQVNDATTERGPGRHRADGDRRSEVRARRLRGRRRGAHGGDHRGHRPASGRTRRSFASSMPPPTPARSTSTSPLRVPTSPPFRRPSASPPRPRCRRATSRRSAPRPSRGTPPTAGTYQIRVTGAGNPSDLRLDIPQVILLNQRVATVILTPTAGGTLANGSVLIERRRYRSTAPPPTPTPGCACSPRSRTAPRFRPPPSRPAPARRSASAPMSSRRRSPPMSTSRRTARSTSR